MSKRHWAMVLDVDTSYGTRQLVARFCYVNEEGELRNPLGDRFEGGAEFADLVVSSYFGDVSPTSPRHMYSQPFNVETHRAEKMLKMLRKIDRGMERLRSTRGYPDGFSEYALRVAEILGVRSFYVRNTERAREASGQMFRRVSGEGVQSYVSTVLMEHSRA